MPFVNVANLEMTYNSASRVGPVSFTVEAGEFVSLLGPSGCGKTTSLRCIAGFAEPSAGGIQIAGRSVLGLAPNKRDIGLVFQNYALFPHLTVFENVAFGLRLRRVGRVELTRRVHEGLEMVGLTGFADRMPGQLSGGQQQRVALARSIVLAPKLLLLDEPLSNLDAKLRVQMRSLLRHLQQQLGITTIYVTHDQTEALAMSDRIVVMNAGKVCQFATPREIYDQPANAFVADFIGNSNLLRGKVMDAGAGGLRCEMPWGSLPMDNALGAFRKGDCVRALVRPESVRLVSSDTSGDASLAVLPAVVDELSYVGDFTDVRLLLGNSEPLDAKLRSRGDRLPSKSEAVLAAIPVDEIYFIKEDNQ